MKEKAPYIPDSDKAIWDALEAEAERIEEEYGCRTCRYRNDCREGEYCYKDYLQGRKYRSTPQRPSKAYDYYFKEGAV